MGPAFHHDHPRPFIYIGALVRTGSTLLSEALTAIPYSYIFHEPHLGRNFMIWNPVDLARWRALGINLHQHHYLRKMTALMLRKFTSQEDYLVRILKERLLPGISSHVAQVGVKETRNEGWRQYNAHFPGMKVILTARDPRDIYLSLHERLADLEHAADLLQPESMARVLMREFNIQMAIHNALDCMLVRYEDLCTDPNLYQEIKAFVDSPLPEMGIIGDFMSRASSKQDEYSIHGNRITGQRISRWRREQGTRAARNAGAVFEMMKAYTDFWGYDHK